MKSFVLIGLLLSTQLFADVVYMQETENGKAVILQPHNGEARTINDLTSKNWAIYPDVTPNGKEVVFVEGPGPEDLSLTYKNLEKELPRDSTHLLKECYCILSSLRTENTFLLCSRN